MRVWQRLALSLLVFSLVFGLMGSALADLTPSSMVQAATRMYRLGLVKGLGTHPDGSPDLALNDQISRAELVTTIVRAFGKEADAKYLNGAAAFPDTATHWASGYIAMAKAIVADTSPGAVLGLPDGKFHPDGRLTPAEAVAFIMKFLGVKADSTKSWPANYLDVAVTVGVMTANDARAISAISTNQATRGQAFYLLDLAFYNYDMGAGKTVYTKFVDTTPPVVTVNPGWPATTSAATVSLTGTVSGAASLSVGYSDQDAVTPNADGTWTATVPLKVGVNAIRVHAMDIAGNASDKAVQITRTAEAASIKVEPGALTLRAGESASLTITVLDQNGVALADAAPSVSVAGGVGTYAGGTFTAGTKPTSGKLTVTAGMAPPLSVSVTVTAARLAKITVSPPMADVKTFQPQQFTADGQDQYGNAVGLEVVTWSASRGRIGADGRYTTLDDSGSATITATVGGVSGTAIATIHPESVATVTSITTWFGNGSGVWTPTDDVPGVRVANAPGGVASVTFELRDVTKNADFTTLGPATTTPDESGWYWSSMPTPLLLPFDVYEVRATVTDKQGGHTTKTGKVIAFDPSILLLTDYTTRTADFQVGMLGYPGGTAHTVQICPCGLPTTGNTTVTFYDWVDANGDGIVSEGELFGTSTEVTSIDGAAVPETPIGDITGRVVMRMIVDGEKGYWFGTPYDRSKFVLTDNVPSEMLASAKGAAIVPPTCECIFAVGLNGLGHTAGTMVSLWWWVDSNSNHVIDNLEVAPIHTDFALITGAKGTLSEVVVGNSASRKLVVQFQGSAGEFVLVIVDGPTVR